MQVIKAKLAQNSLVELPLGVFGVAMATVILPTLSGIFSRKETAAFAKTLDWGIQWVLFLGVPAAVGLCVLAKPLLITLFNYGSFSEHDVAASANSLRAYSLGLVAFMLIKVLSPGYFSRQDTKTPVRIGVIAMVSNMAMNLALIVPLAHVGLALATSLSAFLNAGLLYRGLYKEGWMSHRSGWLRFIVALSVGLGLMAGVLTVIVPPAQWWFEQHWWMRSGALLGVTVAGLMTFLVAVRLCGLRPSYMRAPSA